MTGNMVGKHFDSMQDLQSNASPQEQGIRLRPKGLSACTPDPQEGTIKTVKAFLVHTQDDEQAGVPDEPLTVEGALRQMLLWLEASHSCHLLASQIPVQHSRSCLASYASALTQQ